MHNQQNQYLDISNQPEIFTPNDSGNLPVAVKRQIARDTAEVVRRSVNMSANLKAQANVANTALNETAGIAAKVAYLNETFPNGENHFNHILNVFTSSASEKVRRFH